jgi:hypothetical protein
MAHKCLLIEVLDAEAKHSVGVSQKTGKPYDFWTQTAYISSGTVYPTPVTLRCSALDGGTVFLPVAVGFYLAPAGSLVQDRLGVTFRPEAPPVPIREAIAELQELDKAAAASAVSRAPRAVAG